MGTVLRWRWLPAVLALVAFGLSLWLQHAVYPHLSWNRDEPVYLWHVEVLRSGQLVTTDGGYPELFQPWLSAARDGTLFSQYTLGWPLVLTIGSLLGSPALGVAAGAALAVVGTWALVRELTSDRLLASVAALALLGSPITAVQGGMHLNYLFTLGLGLLCVTATLAGVRRQRRGLLVVAGVMLGWIFFTRPFDAVLWGLLAAVPVLIEHRRHLPRLVGPAGWAALGAIPIVATTLILNRRLTGSFTEFPITVADPLDTFGFGERRLMPGFDKVPYGKRLALESVGRNSFWLPFFLVGAHAGLLVAAIGAWSARADRRVVGILIALGLLFPVGYFPFFGTHISSLTARLSGPIYFIPAYAALCGLIALGLVHLMRQRVAVGLGAAGVLAAVSLVVTVDRLDVNHRLSEANRPWATSTADLEGPALVVTPPDGYLLFMNPFGHNGTDLEGDVLFAVDGGPTLLRLIRDLPDRTPYLQRADLPIPDLLPSERPRTPDVRLDEMTLVTGAVRLLLDTPPSAATTHAWFEIDGQSVGSPWPIDRLPTSVALAAGNGATFADTILELPEGLLVLAIILGDGRTDDPKPSVRRTLYVEVADGSLTVLAPGTAARMVLRPGAVEARWEEARDLPELGLEITGQRP